MNACEIDGGDVVLGEGGIVCGEMGVSKGVDGDEPDVEFALLLLLVLEVEVPEAADTCWNGFVNAPIPPKLDAAAAAVAVAVCCCW